MDHQIALGWRFWQRSGREFAGDRSGDEPSTESDSDADFRAYTNASVAYTNASVAYTNTAVIELADSANTVCISITAATHHGGIWFGNRNPDCDPVVNSLTRNSTAGLGSGRH
jgi:hypothetical protein